jgi:hypothetical protein
VNVSPTDDALAGSGLAATGLQVDSLEGRLSPRAHTVGGPLTDAVIPMADERRRVPRTPTSSEPRPAAPPVGETYRRPWDRWHAGYPEPVGRPRQVCGVHSPSGYEHSGDEYPISSDGSRITRAKVPGLAVQNSGGSPHAGTKCVRILRVSIHTSGFRTWGRRGTTRHYTHCRCHAAGHCFPAASPSPANDQHVHCADMQTRPARLCAVSFPWEDSGMETWERIRIQRLHDQTVCRSPSSNGASCCVVCVAPPVG